MEEVNIFEEIKRLIPFLGKENAAKLEAAYLLGNENYRKRILEIIDGLKALAFSDTELRESALIEPPPREVVSHGEIKLGKILYGKKELYPLFINKKDLLTHIGIFGSSGSGKTNIVHYLVKALIEKEIPVLIFDFSKRNYRDLLTLPEVKDRITVYTVGRNVVPFRFNPLKPPEGVQISQWTKEFAEVFDHAYWLLGGGRHIILKALDELYAKFSPSYPKIPDIKEWLEKFSYSQLSPRERNWVATAKRPLESLCLRETGEIFDCEEGVLPSTFFEKGKVTVLELDALSSDDKTFLIEILLQWIRDWLLVSNTRERLVGVIVLEEAHHVLNREKTKKFGVEAVTDLIFREIRELGIGMIYADQHPSLVSYPALGNTSTHIYMNLGLDTKYSSDIQDASNMLGLKKEEDIDYLRRLPTGHAFILIRKSVFPNPFLVKFPLVLKERGKISDEDLKELMNEKVFKEIKLKPKVEELPKKETKDIERKMEKVSSNGWKIIFALGELKGTSTSEIYRQIKMSCRVFNEEARKLVKLGLIGSRVAKVYKQKARYYFLTHEGELAFILKRKKIPETKEFEIDWEKINRILGNKGFSVLEKKENKLLCEKEGRRVVVIVENSNNRNKIFQDVKSVGKEAYFICLSKDIKYSVIQQVAKYSYIRCSINFTVFLATLEELESRDFKKVEFVATEKY